MTTLTQQQIDDLQDELDNNDVVGFYTLLDSYGDPYGKLGLEVTNNSGWQGALANAFAASGGGDNSVDLSYGSTAWTSLNKAIADAYIDAINTNSGGLPTRDDIQTIHNNEYQSAGLDDDDWLPNKLLNDSSSPDTLWADFMTNEGGADMWNDAFAAAGSGAYLIFGPALLYEGMTNPNAFDDAEVDFARNFLIGLAEMGSSDLTDMGLDVTGIDDLVDLLKALPEGAKGLLESIGDIIDNPDVLLDRLPGLSDLVEGVIDDFAESEYQGSPLVLDIDGDGIELAALGATGSVYWDIDLDGFAEASGWIAGGDGLLAIDLDSDGVINDHGELFGDQTGSNNGFAALSVYDTNSDGDITSADTQFDDLLVWIDTNADGYSQADELHTLDDLSITSIDLGYSDVSYTISGNEILQESTFTINGQTRDIVDAWFTYDNVNSLYTTDYSLDIRTVFLPTVRGYGTLPDLHIAMSQNEDLLDLVEELATADLEDLLDPSFDAEGKIVDIMYEWAGVTNVSPTSRGPYLSDARKLEFLEELMGREFESIGNANSTIWDDDPGSYPATFVESAFNKAFNQIFADILAQTALGTLLEDAHYNAVKGVFEGFSDINDTVFSDIEDLADTSSDPGYLWEQVLRTVENAIGLDNLDSADRSALLTASISSGTAIDGTSGNDSLTGTGDNETLNGFDGNDTLAGSGGNDTLIGGAGSDGLQGGAGNDLYVFATGFGSSGNPDFITETLGNGTDTVYMTGGITPDDVYFWVDNAGYLNLQLVSDSDDYVRGLGGIDSTGTLLSDYIEYIAFENGITWDLSEGLTQTDTNDGHVIIGSSKDDVINGNGGVDQIYGYAGNDILIGGTGRDLYWGGTGDDTYMFAAGFGDSSAPETITENVNEGDDTLYIQGTLTPDDVYFWTDGAGNGDFHLQFVANSDDYVRGTAGLDANGTTVSSRIEYISFESGTFWDLSQALHLNDNDDSHFIHAAATDDTISGNGGNDQLFGYAGNDVLDGGTGNDVMYGGTGVDTVSYASSSSAVTVNLSTNSATGDGSDTLYELENITGSAFDDTLTGDNNDNVIDGGDGNDTVDYSSNAELVYVDLGAGEADEDDDTVMDDTLLNIERVVGSAYADEIIGDGGNNIIWGGAGADTLKGANGDDEIHGGDGDDALLYGGNGADTLYGDAGADDVRGGDGNDILYGGDGDDDMSGQNDDDILNGGAGDDILNGNQGIDTADYSDNTTRVFINLAQDKADDDDDTIIDDTLLNIENATGSAFDDEIIGGSEDSVLKGGDGEDRLKGGGGNDTLYGGNGDDILLYGGDGTDTVYGDDGDDEVRGGDGNDTLYGGNGSDDVQGQNDDDILIGGQGADSLTGGSGADTIKWLAGDVDGSVDNIYGFSSSSGDKLDVADILSGYDPLTDAITDFVQITDDGTSSTLKVDADGGADNFVTVALLVNKLNMTDEAALESAGTLITA